MADYMTDYMEAKYHLIIAKRMLESYRDYPEKRFLIGVINEGARAASGAVRAFLIHNKTRGGIREFLKRIAPKYLDTITSNNLVKMLEIERAQKISRIEFSSNDKIILLVDGKYKILTISRLKEFIESINNILTIFATSIKR